MEQRAAEQSRLQVDLHTGVSCRFEISRVFMLVHKISPGKLKLKLARKAHVQIVDLHAAQQQLYKQIAGDFH